MNTAVRVMLRNPMYVGEVIWNRSHWTQTPECASVLTGPEAEWIRHKDESLRIIDQALWNAVQRDIKAREGDQAGKQKPSGGGAKYLLAGLSEQDCPRSNSATNLNTTS